MAHSLPAALSSFVGRHEELTTVTKLLDSARLVTLVGAGGVGKTRLALQVASTAAPLHDDGAWLVQLAPVTDPSLVAEAVAAALGVREQPGHTMPQALFNRLSSRRHSAATDALFATTEEQSGKKQGLEKHSAALPQHMAVRLCLTGAVFFETREALPPLVFVEAQPLR